MSGSLSKQLNLNSYFEVMNDVPEMGFELVTFDTPNHSHCAWDYEASAIEAALKGT